MRKVKFLLIALLALLIIPFSVFAEEENNNSEAEEDNRISVYLFRGEGCPHCAEAEEFFESIEEEYSQYFKVVDYETWKNTDNALLMEKVAEARGEEVGGVPYIIIGNKSWNGYSSEFDDEIKEAIKAEFDTSIEQRYDIMELIDTGSTGDGAVFTEKSNTNDAVVLVAILIVLGFIIAGVALARKKTV